MTPKTFANPKIRFLQHTNFLTQFFLKIKRLCTGASLYEGTKILPKPKQKVQVPLSNFISNN